MVMGQEFTERLHFTFIAMEIICIAINKPERETRSIAHAITYSQHICDHMVKEGDQVINTFSLMEWQEQGSAESLFVYSGIKLEVLYMIRS